MASKQGVFLDNTVRVCVVPVLAGRPQLASLQYGHWGHFCFSVCLSSIVQYGLNTYSTEHPIWVLTLEYVKLIAKTIVFSSIIIVHSNSTLSFLKYIVC